MFDGFVGIWHADLLYAAVIVIVSAVLHGYTGFGAGVFMVPLFALLFGPIDAVAIAVIMGLFGAIPLYPRAARAARWRELAPVCMAIAVLTPVGTYLLFHVKDEIIQDAMGALVLAAALILLSGWTYKGSRGIVPSAVAGGLGGSITGAAGVGGPALALYFLSAPAPPAEQRANIVISVAAVLLVALICLIVGGGVSAGIVHRAIVLTPIYIFGTWLGGQLFAVARKEYFRRAALWLLVASGLGILIV